MSAVRQRFSEVFGVTIGDEDDWFDPLLTSDTKLFVDPFRVYADDSLSGVLGYANRQFGTAGLENAWNARGFASDSGRDGVQSRQAFCQHRLDIISSLEEPRHCCLRLRVGSDLVVEEGGIELDDRIQNGGCDRVIHGVASAHHVAARASASSDVSPRRAFSSSRPQSQYSLQMAS